MNAPLPGDVLAAVLDALPDPVLLINSNGTVLAANSPAHQAFQAPGTVLVGLGVLDLLPGLDPRRIPGSMRPADGPGPAETVRTTARRTDGTAFPAEIRTSELDSGPAALLMPSTAHAPTGLLLLVARDLTDSRRIHRELLRLRAETETVLRTCSEGLLGIDAEGRCVLANPAALRLLRYRPDEISDLPVQSLLQPGAPAAPPAVLTALATGRRCGGTALLRRSDGLPVAVDLQAVPVHVDGQVVGAMMAFTDRSRELAAEAERAQLTALLRDRLGPSTAVLADRLARLAHDPASRLWPEAVGELRELAGEFASSRELVEVALADCPPPAGAVDPVRAEPVRAEPVELRQVLCRAVDRASSLAGSGRVRFTVHAAAVEVSADPYLLAEALAHLAADAGGAGPTTDPVPGDPRDGQDPPTVRLAGERDGSGVRIEITGPGGHGSSGHLPLAREMVAVHGGVLQPRRPTDRPGITYVVDLPLVPVDRPAFGGPERPAPGTGRRRARPAAVPELPHGAAIAALPARIAQPALGPAPTAARVAAAGRHRAAPTPPGAAALHLA
ncbi:PAS domain-containing protein [Kitasatospora sp. NPDC094015]|uniref:PAS domain-containing protein n=1 Tax=Kitasatospora sp. NPDC094015 TaxID=3155205 RepID=UPI00332EDF57